MASPRGEVGVRALVTGGAGFIGSHLVDRLVAEGEEVVVLDDLSTGRLENLASSKASVVFRKGDIRDAEAVGAAVADCDVVFHLAAKASVAGSVEEPEVVTDVNVGGTVNVLLAARDAGVRRVVFASSSSVYGDAPTLPKVETMAPWPLSPYAASKAAGESYCASFQGSYRLESAVLRFFNVYGPRQDPRSRYAAVVPCFAAAALAGQAPVVDGDGKQTRDFTYVADLVGALLLAAAAPKPPDGPVNLGAGKPVSVLDVAAAVAAATGTKLEPVHAAPRPGDVRDSVASVEKAARVLGWRATTPLAEGVRRVVESLRPAAAAARGKP
jgi:UDP-glucose 4-epimerase